MTGSQTLYVGSASGLLIYHTSGAGLAPRGQALAGRAVTAIVALDAETLLVAATGLPPQQSFDGGVSWSDAPGAAVEPVGLRAATAHGPMALANPRLMGATAYAWLGGRPPMLVGAGAGGALIFRSLDDGIHWEAAATPEEMAGRVTAIAPGSGATVWAGTDAGLILRSDDRGATWREAARAGASILCLTAAASSQ